MPALPLPVLPLPALPRSVPAALAVAAALLVALPALPAHAAGVTDVAAPLAVGRVRAVVADAHEHVYVATDAGVLVTDAVGRPLRTVSYNQVLGLSLSRDGSRLYLAERGNGALSAVDTASAKVVARYALPAGVCPVSIAATDRYLAFGYDCSGNGSAGGIGFLPLAAPRSKPVLTPRSDVGYLPLVRALPTGDKVIAVSPGVSPATAVVLGPGGVVRSRRLDSCSNASDLAVARDGRSFVPACGAPYQFDRYSVTALAVTGSLLARPYPTAVAVSPNGRLTAGGIDGAYDPDVYVYPAGANPRPPVEIGTAVPQGLAFSASGTVLYAVGLKTDGHYVLHTLPGQATAGS